MPHYLSQSYKAWCLGDSNHVTSQCGQAEFVKLFISSYKNKCSYSYLDVGANDGVTNSSTFILACSGWSGLCIEPNPRFHEKISGRAKNSLYLGCAIGQDCGVLNLLTSESLSVLSTLENSPPAHIQRIHRESAQAGEPLISMPVPVITASIIFNYYFSIFEYCDFLKIDCEGQELSIIKYLCNINPSQLPLLIEYENNYQSTEIAELLISLGYSPLVVFDSFAEIWCNTTSLPDATCSAELALSKLLKATGNYIGYL